MTASGWERKAVGLGTCPSCGASIPSDNLLIRYEAEGGWPRILGKCPDCRDPVLPR